MTAALFLCNTNWWLISGNGAARINKKFALKALFVDRLQTLPQTACAVAELRQRRAWIF